MACILSHCRNNSYCHHSYGDKTPKSLVAQLFSVIWIMIGITLCSMLTATLSSAFTNVTVDYYCYDIYKFPYLFLLFQNVLETKLSISIIKLMVTSSLLIACLHKTCCCPGNSDLRERAQVLSEKF